MENNVEIIDKYLNNELSGTELKNFENKIENDKKFAKEIELQREVDNFLYDKETSEFRKQLSSIYKKDQR